MTGVDSYRGPYHEEVSTVTVSCHGCRYESKYEVLPDATVTLQLNGGGQDSERIPVRGRVRWTQRPTEHGGLFQTAIELDAPGNVWGIDSPPSDWLPFCRPRRPESDESRAKTVAFLLPEVAPSQTKEERRQVLSPRASGSVSPLPSATRPVGQLMGDFQTQMERMLWEGAETVVRLRTTEVLNDMHARLREEAEQIVSEVATSQASLWIDESVKRMNLINEESARAHHAQWTKQIEAGFEQALTRLETRHRELEEVYERLMTRAQGQLQRLFEASYQDAVDRIISRLKQQAAPVIDDVRKAVVDLTKREAELGKTCERYVERSAAQVEETCTRLDHQFEMILKERLDSARE